MVVPTEMKLEGKAKELMMQLLLKQLSRTGSTAYYLFRLFELFCCDADASAFVVGVLGANAREAC